MRITASPEISTDELEGADAEPWPKFIEQYNELGRQVVANINRSGPFLDCPTSRLISLDMVHAASVTVKNPLDVPIKSIAVVSCVGLSVDSTGKPTRGVYNLGYPTLEWHNSTKADGSVVITPNYPPPLGLVDLWRSTSQSSAVSTVTPVQWTNDMLSLPAVGTLVTSGNFTYDITTTSGSPAVNSQINCLASGRVRISAGAFLDNSTVGSFRQMWVQKNSISTTRYMSSLGPPAGYFGVAGSGEIAVAAGDYLQLVVQQDAGTLNILGGSQNGPRFGARYVDSIGALGHVGLLFLGSD